MPDAASQDSPKAGVWLVFQYAGSDPVMTRCVEPRASLPWSTIDTFDDRHQFEAVFEHHREGVRCIYSYGDDSSTVVLKENDSHVSADSSLTILSRPASHFSSSEEALDAI